MRARGEGNRNEQQFLLTRYISQCCSVAQVLFIIMVGCSDTTRSKHVYDLLKTRVTKSGWVTKSGYATHSLKIQIGDNLWSTHM